MDEFHNAVSELGLMVWALSNKSFLVETMGGVGCTTARPALTPHLFSKRQLHVRWGVAVHLAKGNCV